ncbi:alpha-galactosidase [Bacteroides acidifaciens]|uniref:alpha-galactosidase n=1 Tax=Bacteroides acidifaciens TaxID=85831 RepID=UPI00242B1110|nr:alpha-galactosidase [Bacteroides acidifaciens]
MKKLLIVLALACTLSSLYAQKTCYSELKGDTLVIGNECIERKFIWNDGNLVTYSLSDKANRKTTFTVKQAPDFFISKDTREASKGACRVEKVAATDIHPAYLKTIVTFSLGTLDIQRIYRIYDGCPAIACDTYLKGSVNSVFGGREENAADRKNIEFVEDMKSKSVTAILDQLYLKGQHWHAKAVEFWDVTDWNNNLLAERDVIAYRKNSYRGNLLFVRNGEAGTGFFFLKESPCSSVQLAYKGADFIAEFGKFMITGLGITEKDIQEDTWTRTYSCVTGVYGEGELQALTALRSYQKNIRRHFRNRDEMVMMNTWGDRSQDTKVNEAFCLQELERAAKLGITHFQIDDGWQVGKSPNSAVAKGSFKNIWDNKDYWKPDPVKYPRGLAPIVKKGKKLGIEIGLWFNPSVQNDFVDWEKDAETLIGLYREYGIRIFKIDGLTIPTKKAEINLRNLFDKVLAETDNKVMFNLDATASRRGGYHMFNEYGNIFLENRYTDWQNYYPYWTLRNLWMLSKYVPAEKLQIEFLNKWRNTEKYGDDPFAPHRYSFEYLFATTMAGQPLAWFEASNLPEEAFGIKDLMEKYKKVQYDFHQGTILPIGEEPSGRSWTGFQSLCHSKNGYLLIYREDNAREETWVETWLPEGAEVMCMPILGNGKLMVTTVGRKGTIKVSLPEKNDFMLYRYEIR